MRVVRTTYGEATIIKETSSVFPASRYIGSEDGYRIYVYDIDVDVPKYYALDRKETL